MAIFGTGSPVIGGTTINYAVVEEFSLDHDAVEHKSNITGKKFFVNSGRYLAVRIIVNLWKNTSATTLYDTLLGLLDTEVTFKLHATNGKNIRNAANSADAKFLVKKVEPFYLETASYKDRLLIELESVERVKIIR